MRYRHKLSQLRTGLKSQVHSVLGKQGVVPSLTTMWGFWREPVLMRHRLRNPLDIQTGIDVRVGRSDAEDGDGLGDSFECHWIGQGGGSNIAGGDGALACQDRSGFGSVAQS